MESIPLSDQKEYDNNKNRNNHSSKNILYKSNSNNHQKSNPCEYYPIESDKSKNGGHTIYLVTKAEENFNEDNGDEINEPRNYNGANINENIKDINASNSKVDDLLISQRSIELQINKGKFIYFLNGSQTFKPDNNNNYDSDYRAVRNRNLRNVFSNKDLNKDKNNIKSVSNNFKSLNRRKITDENRKLKLNYKKINEKDNKNNSLNKSTAYIRKINIKQKSNKENGILNEHSNSNSKKLNRSVLLKYGKNQKLDILKTIPESKFKNLDDIVKHSLTKNNSLFDLFPKSKNKSDMNRSNNKKDNINSFYNSLEYFKNNINEDLDNSKIMEKSFLCGMKNEDRKKSLKNAITIYNRFKSFGKFKKMNLYSNPLSPLATKIKYDINKDDKTDDINNNKNNNEKNIDDKNIDNNKVIDDVDNDNIEKNNENNNNENIYESSIINFNDTINIKEEKENESFGGENIDHEFSFTSELKKNEETKDNINIEENTSKNNILKDNELIDVLSTEIIDQSNKEEKIEKREKREKREKEEDKEDIKNENNIHKNLNKSVDIKSNKKQTRNIDFNLDINNDINKTINEENINTKKNKPSYFVRKVIREEHYYIDENGKEKLLEVKQRLINDEANIKKFKKTPYVKKNLSVKGLNSKNKRKDEKNRNTYFKTHRYNNYIVNMDENDRDKISKNFKKLNKLKKKINLTYLENENKEKMPERTVSKEIKLDESNLTEIMPDSILSKQNDIFKDFNKFFFKNKQIENNLNDINNKKNTAYFQIKTEDNKIYKKNFNEPASVKQRNILSLNKNNLEQKDIFNIKKEKPIIIKSVNFYDKSSKLTRYKPFLNIKSNSNEKIKINISDKKNNNNNVNESPVKEEEGKEEDENEKENKLKEIDSYIKVNKMENYKKINTEKILNMNNKIIKNYPKRDFNKNHVFHEIKASKNSKKRLSSNSQSNYFTHDVSNDDLNTSNRTHEYSINTLNTERRRNLMINIHNSNTKNANNLSKTMEKQKNFENKSNSESYFILNSRISNRNNKEKNHHRYYESRSTKNKLKESDNESDVNTRRYTTNYSFALDKNNYKNLYKNDSRDRYFYQNWGNNSPTSAQYNNE